MSVSADGWYLLPRALLHGHDAQAAFARGVALPLAGRRLAFAAGWLVHRCADSGEISRRLLSAEALRRKAEEVAAVARLLELTGGERPPFAGLEMDRPRIMGIVNVTPDSFSDGGLFHERQAAIDHGRRLAEAGADVLDVGGESTRPGAQAVDVQEELDRVVPVIDALAGDGLLVSVDTRKSEVMRAAVAAGARIVNDVSALQFDAQARSVLAALDVPVILMHMRGTPDNMMKLAEYDDVVLEVMDELHAAVRAAEAAGIARSNIMIDPGIGFAKRTGHNVHLTRHLAALHGLGLPLLHAASRKRFIGEITGVEDAPARDAGSLAVAQLAWLAGAQMVRVHDVARTAQVRAMVEAIVLECA